ncbi:MAG: hypothetical protein KDA31_02165 [Phycisphaerales bacterium]|nr:hypothetical protein [Phycisphaerales bacterium]
MVQSAETTYMGRLRGSQAAALLAQGTLGTELIARAERLTREATAQSRPATRPIVPDQAEALRCAVNAPQSTRFGGDAA